MLWKTTLATIFAVSAVLTMPGAANAVTESASAQPVVKSRRIDRGGQVWSNVGPYRAIVKCQLQGPLTGPDRNFAGSFESAGTWATAKCGTGYWYGPRSQIGIDWK